MELQEDQKAKVRAWAEEGCGLSEIQRRLADECGITMTFMDVRFLVLDLGVEIKEKNKPQPPKEPAAAPAEQSGQPAPDAAPGPAGPLAGGLDDGAAQQQGVSVEIDRVMKPGALVSGSAVFRDGTSATWMLDQTGRLALQGPTPEYRPSPEDIQEFQEVLQQELAKRGY